jgi:hypothetical protein
LVKVSITKVGPNVLIYLRKTFCIFPKFISTSELIGKGIKNFGNLSFPRGPDPLTRPDPLPI